MQNDKADGELAFALLIIRWSAAAFPLIWALDIFLGSVAALKTFSKLYVPLDSAMVVGLIGVLQSVLLLVFAVGTFRTWTYGAVVFMHAGSTLASCSKYLEPWDRPNILFWATILVLGPLVAFFILRRRDTLFAFDARSRGSKNYSTGSSV
jgi:putative oxidoreductase